MLCDTHVPFTKTKKIKLTHEKAFQKYTKSRLKRGLIWRTKDSRPPHLIVSKIKKGPFSIIIHLKSLYSRPQICARRAYSKLKKPLLWRKQELQKTKGKEICPVKTHQDLLKTWCYQRKKGHGPVLLPRKKEIISWLCNNSHLFSFKGRNKTIWPKGFSLRKKAWEHFLLDHISWKYPWCLLQNQRNYWTPLMIPLLDEGRKVKQRREDMLQGKVWQKHRKSC